MNSHKQLPKFVIKNFKNNTGKVYYYSFNNDVVGNSGPSVLGTEEGYYVESLESKLNSKIESPFSSLLDKIIKGLINNEEIIMIDKDDEVARNYFSCSMFRSEFAYDNFLLNSYFASLFEKSFITSFTVNATIDSGNISYVDNKVINIVKNLSNMPFITSRNGYSLISSFGKECIFIPFHPYYAIILVPIDYPTKHSICMINDEKDIEYLNWQIVLFEYIYNNDFIIGIDKSYLEKIRKKIKNQRTGLDNLRRNIQKEINEEQSESKNQN